MPRAPPGRRRPAPPDTPERSRATLARLLPDRWYVRIAVGDNVEDVWSAPVRRDLAMAPNVAEIPEGGGIRDLLRSQDLWWMADFEEAVDAGMAVRVPLDAETARNISVLIVLGVRDTDPAAPAELAGLLEAHRFTSGLEIVPHGTPTNTTATVDAGYADVPADLDAYMARQLAEPPAERPPPVEPVALATAPAADALALALGLDGATAFDAAEHAGDRAGARATAMNRALWPATWGHFFSTLLATGGTPIVHGDDLDWLRAWFRDWVRGAGPLPLFRAGEQAYGVLPVTVLPEWGFPGTRVGHLQSLLDTLLYDWAYGLSGVAAFSWPAARTPEEEAVAVAAVLGAVPHPTAFRLRRALDRYDLFAGQWQEGLAELERLLATTPSVLVRDEYELRARGPDPQRLDRRAVGQPEPAAGAGRRHGRPNPSTPGSRPRRWRPSAITWTRCSVPTPPATRPASETRRLAEGFSDATLPDAADPALWYVEYGDDGAAADGTFPDLGAGARRRPGGGSPAAGREPARAGRRRALGHAPPIGPPTTTRRPSRCSGCWSSTASSRSTPPRPRSSRVGLDRLAEMCEGAAVGRPLRRARAPDARDAGPGHPSPRRVDHERGHRAGWPSCGPRSPTGLQIGGVRLARRARRPTRPGPTPRASSTPPRSTTPPPPPCCAAPGSPAPRAPPAARSASTCRRIGCGAPSGCSRGCATASTCPSCSAPDSSAGSTTPAWTT